MKSDTSIGGEREVKSYGVVNAPKSKANTAATEEDTWGLTAHDYLLFMEEEQLLGETGQGAPKTKKL